MAFNYPCDLENMDVVLPFKLSDKLYISVNAQNKLLNAEGNNGYAYVVAGTTPEKLKLSIEHVDSSHDKPMESDTVAVSAIEILHRWRSLILDGVPTLVLGCEDYWCDTALCGPNGVLYPHPYTIVSYLVDRDGKAVTDTFNSLRCAGSQTQLIVNVLYNNDDLLKQFYQNDLKIVSEPLVYLADQYKMINCEGSTCSVPMAIAHSAIARQKANNEENNNV